MIVKNKLNHLTKKTKEGRGGRKNIAPTAKPAERRRSSKTFKR